MQVTELESKGLKKTLRIVVEAAQINAQMEAELKRAGERIKIPGFRPGFIPMKVLQQRYGKSVQADVLKQVINQSSNDVIVEKKLRPALTPQINIEDYKEEGDLTYSMTFEVFPECRKSTSIKLRSTAIRSTSPKKISTKRLFASPSAARSSSAPRTAAKAQSGNVVTIDFKGMIDGVAFKGGSAEGFRLELGSGQFIEGFEDQLVGTKEGSEKTVKVTFPKDYQAQDLAGKEASFAVKVKEIFRKETPVIDDEFAKARGFADLRALREAIRNQMLKEYEQVVRNPLKKQLFDELEAQFDFELPQGMVDLEFNTIWERLKQAQAEGDPSMEGKSEEELKKEYKQIAERRVKLGLLLAEIGNRNKIQISREELGRAVMQQASMYPGQEKQIMEFYRNHPERAEDLRGPILEEKAVDFILGSKIQRFER